ncbi:hypothetical protein [Flavobacterium sp.]|uniref:hypothetical protein n=1 Tax=Flavobacterium sp. TaxID=239 RepID=UPI003D6BAA4D
MIETVNTNTSDSNSKAIIIMDNVIIGNNHLVVNSSIINIAQNLLNESGSGQILFYGESRHMETLATLADTEKDISLQFNSIEVTQPHFNKVLRIISWGKKLYKDAVCLKQIVKEADRIKPRFFIVSTMIPLNIYRFMSIMNSHKKQNFLMFLHGELEFIFKKKPTTGQRIKGFFIEKAIQKAGPNVRFIVLSDYIKKELVRKLSLDSRQIISINHPVLQYTRKNIQLSDPIVFAHLGVANKRKNSKLIFPLADAVQESNYSENARFAIIGRIEEQEIQIASDHVDVMSKNKQAISQEAYISHIEAAHYSLIFLSGDEYVYRISGSLLDSVQFQIPIIALEHQSVVELFEKGGDIGFLCKDFDEMKQVVIKLSQKDPLCTDRYATQIINLKKLSEKFYSKNASEIISEATKS